MGIFLRLSISIKNLLLSPSLICLCALPIVTNCQKRPAKSLSVLGSNSDCYYYERDRFDIEESFILLGQSASGKKIKSDLSNLKKLQFKTFSDLSKQEIKKSNLNVERSFAAYLPPSLTKNNVPTLAYKKKTPLYIFTLILAHEAQHYIDSNVEWTKILFDERKSLVSVSNQKNNSRDTNINAAEAFELALGLKFLRTVMLEYKGFSAAAAVKESLEDKIKCLGGVWSKFNDKNNIPMIDPRLSTEDTKKLIELYVWGGNNRRLQLGVDYVRKNRDILNAFKEDRIILDKVSDALRLIAASQKLKR